MKPSLSHTPSDWARGDGHAAHVVQVVQVVRQRTAVSYYHAILTRFESTRRLPHKTDGGHNVHATSRQSGRAWVACGAALLACATTVRAQNPRDHHVLGSEKFTSRTLVTGLDNPWDMAWGPDGYLWVTERTGFRVTRINPEDGSKHNALTLTDVYQSVVQDGLLGLTLHPDLLRGRDTDHVFLAYTYDRDPGPSLDRRLRVRRYTYDRASQRLKDPVTLLENLPAHDDHGAGRLIIGPDGKLYLSRGDQGSNWLTNYCNSIRSQDLPTAAQVAAGDWTTYQGKVLRMNLDGSIPDDNPLFTGVRSHIFAMGLRNSQGVVFGPGGVFLASDHGPSTDDEINVIEGGRNYGWPRVAGFKDDRAYAYANWSASAPTPCASLKFDSVTPPPSVPRHKESEWDDAAFTPPITTFFTVAADYDIAKHGAATIGIGGIDIYTSTTIPGWAPSLLVTGMRGGGVYRVSLAGDARSVVGSPVEYFRTANRYRDIVVNPDGRHIYVSTDNFGTTMGVGGARTSRMGHPGAILEFTYAGPEAGR